MKHRICLVNSRLEGPYPPLGLGYLASYLEKYGHYDYDFKIIDGNCEKNIFDTVKSFNPEIIGFTALSPQIKDVVDLSKGLRSVLPETYQILGGIHATAEPEKSLRRGSFDSVVIGEGEKTFQELVDYRLSGNTVEDGLSKIPGLAFLKDDHYFSTGVRGEIDNLDSIPFPKRELFDMRYYLSQHLLIRGITGNKITTIHTSRGCPFNCAFCSCGVVFKKVRYFSIEYAINELKGLVEKFGAKAVFFTDDTFILDKKRVRNFCDALVKSALSKKIKWEVQGRANLINWDDLELLKFMKKAGCVQIDYGFEVGDNDILQFLKKENVSIELNKRAIEVTKKAGLKVLGTFMLAVPGETDKQMEKTEQFIKDNLKDIDFFQVFIATPYPGSELYNVVLNQGLVEENYLDQLELEKKDDKIRIYSKTVTYKRVIEILANLEKLMVKKFSLIKRFNWLLYNILHYPKDTIRRILYFISKIKRSKNAAIEQI